MAFELRSEAFAAGAMIPPRYTGDGEDLSPPLSWSAPPDGTRSLALVCSDPDAPNGAFHHWALFDISPELESIGAGHSPVDAGIGREGVNDFGLEGYRGPAPPRAHGPHHYHFRLYALNVERLPMAMPARAADVERVARRHAVATAELIGLYKRQP